ncbi:hypothetical protein K2173_026253 [Erythroxylum novogranatense]|uniref:Uncharacterized protein n=1 Tax=Erythroxylum novogranatense TaxID=1862640 RepID=A0AAV8SBU8_9ROSI|nr:hypothetical protein K2173_026253 [Erythroxylum novogranatense]
MWPRMWELLWLVVVLLSSAVPSSCTDEYSRKDFPPGFVFGAATSAYQVEGAANMDGRSESIWDIYTHEGNLHGATGDVALDEYHKYKEDVQLMVETGLEAYKFSISWSRLIPKGRGRVNPKGLEYYNNLINELVKNGIQPHVTIYHDDHPQILEDEYGGWVNRKMLRDFTAYANVCFREFGDRVRHWVTINEPNIFAIGGYDGGMFPPRRCSPPFGFNCTRGNSTSEPYLAAHHMLLAHASASRLYRTKYQRNQQGQVGLTLYAFWFAPATNSIEDITATERAKDFFLGWFAKPLVFGDYPDVMKKRVGSRLPTFTARESKLVKGSLDFLGLIHYTAFYIKDLSNGPQFAIREFFLDTQITFSLENISYTGYQYPLLPWAMRGLLEYFKQDYGNPPIYIHENGQVTPRNLTMEDSARIEYLQTYIGAVLDTVRNGSNTIGYFVWSLMDVLEVLDGYGSSYGLYYVDLDDPELKRQPKLSQHWYSEFLKGKRVGLDGVLELEKNTSGRPHALSFQFYQSQ